MSRLIVPAHSPENSLCRPPERLGSADKSPLSPMCPPAAGSVRCCHTSLLRTRPMRLRPPAPARVSTELARYQDRVSSNLLEQIFKWSGTTGIAAFPKVSLQTTTFSSSTPAKEYKVLRPE